MYIPDSDKASLNDGKENDNSTKLLEWENGAPSPDIFTLIGISEKLPGLCSI